MDMPSWMNDWLLLSLVTMLAYAAWGIFGKLSDRFGRAPAAQKTLLASVGFNILTACSCSHLRPEDFASIPTPCLAILVSAGVLCSLGNGCYTRALETGDASTVTALSGLYPALTFLGSAAGFGEVVTFWKCAGVSCALSSGLCYSRPEPGDKAASESNAGNSSNTWMVPTLLSAVAWGSTGLVCKTSDAFGDVLGPQKALLIALGMGSCSLLGSAHLGVKDFTSMPLGCMACSLLSGAMNGLGTVLAQTAMRLGDVSTVTALTGLYPAVVFVFAVVAMGESPTFWKLGGVACALGSGFCFAQ